MPTAKLTNYLRTYRKRAGLSQDEVAFLLGCKSGSKISRYERFRRQPGLIAVFFCEALFSTPASELFAGVYEQARQALLRRAFSLLRRLSAQAPTRALTRKIRFLQALLEIQEEDQADQRAQTYD